MTNRTAWRKPVTRWLTSANTQKSLQLAPARPDGGLCGTAGGWHPSFRGFRRTFRPSPRQYLRCYPARQAVPRRTSPEVTGRNGFSDVDVGPLATCEPAVAEPVFRRRGGQAPGETRRHSGAGLRKPPSLASPGALHHSSNTIRAVFYVKPARGGPHEHADESTRHPTHRMSC